MLTRRRFFALFAAAPVALITAPTAAAHRPAPIRGATAFRVMFDEIGDVIRRRPACPRVVEVIRQEVDRAISAGSGFREFRLRTEPRLGRLPCLPGRCIWCDPLPPGGPWRGLSEFTAEERAVMAARTVDADR